MNSFLRSMVVVVIALISRGALAGDVFYSVPVSELKIIEGTRPAPATQPDWRASRMLEPRVVINGPGEVTVLSDGPEFNRWNTREQRTPTTIVVRVPAAREISGWLFLPKSDRSGSERLRFTIPADTSKPGARDDFYTAQLSDAIARMNDQSPGSAWFRYRAGQATAALGAGNPTTQRAGLFRQQFARTNDLDSTYSLFSGGRAVSENLQLDRTIRMRDDKKNSQLEAVSDIRGIETAAIDWTAPTKDLHPAVDPLAQIVPIDQHAILMPSFDAAVNLANFTDEHGTPILSTLDTRPEDAMSRQRYERQLGLSLSALSKLIGPAMVDSIALTGSDPYYRVGTDIAVIYHSSNATAVRDLLLAKISFENLTTSPKRANGEIAGLTFASFLSDDRSVSSFVAQSGDVVIVTNSLKQLERIADVIAKKSPALSSAPEYIYFRDRYPRGASDETAFVILTDATIRRWCGPRWRIADSRRTRAAAQLAELQARLIDQHSIGEINSTIDLGEVKQVGDRVVSSIYGRCDSMTPIVELNVDRCGHDESTGYGAWRDQYQSNWRWAFDPIAAKLTNMPQKFAFDLSVRPLIAGTDYREFIEVCSGVSLDANSGDPHDAMLHFVMALNRDAPAAKQWTNMGSTFMGGQVDLMNWIGKSAAIYFDHDPMWAQLKDKEAIYHLPIALRIESGNALKLAAFLTALHGWAEQSAPNLTIWTTLKHNDLSYVKITAAPAARDEMGIGDLAIFYAATGDALVVSLNEDVIKRALDRHPANSPTTQPAPTTRPWMGESVAFQCDRGIFDLIRAANRYSEESLRREMQERSWRNLFILNEWKRLFPNEDPLAVHERLWATQLIDPAGGKYVWNEKWRTMESTVYGHPGEPKAGSEIPPVLNEFSFFNAGISFENQGLRARVQLDRDADAR